MVKVAVAGGTGGVGRTIVEELVRQSKHNVIILSRKVSQQSTSTLRTFRVANQGLVYPTAGPGVCVGVRN